MEKHPDGEDRVQIDGYVCSDCGGRNNFCRWCFGTGVLSEERLAALNWHYTQVMARGAE